MAGSACRVGPNERLGATIQQVIGSTETIKVDVYCHARVFLADTKRDWQRPVLEELGTGR